MPHNIRIAGSQACVALDWRRACAPPGCTPRPATTGERNTLSLTATPYARPPRPVDLACTQAEVAALLSGITQLLRKEAHVTTQPNGEQVGSPSSSLKPLKAQSDASSTLPYWCKWRSSRA